MIVKRYDRRPAICAGKSLRNMSRLDGCLQLIASRRSGSIAGVQQFLGQYITDWNSVLAALSMAILPVVVIYVILSRQLIAGLTSGAVK